MKMQLVFATNNEHKLSEIGHLFGQAGLDCSLLSLKHIGLSGEIPEDFTTLHENAHAKASWVMQRSGRDCFADDTGLEIDALDGRPGVFSARYAGEGCSFEDNVAKVLGEMRGISRRNSRFRTVIALLLRGEEYYFEGVVEGEILEAPTGSKGFGYDPIFRPFGFNQSFAEMSLDVKNRISHRGMAFKKMADFLKSESF